MHSYLVSSLLTLLIALSKSECNLLQSGNTAYIDTESEASIVSMCAKDISSLSLWEQYQCEFIQNRDGYQKCWPQRRMSTCPPGSLKGAIFFYHGYSACPDQYNVLSPKLQNECYDVYQILSLGHGFTPCSDSTCIEGRWNLTAMPTQRQPYIDYIHRMIAAITDEVSIIKECEVTANPAYDTTSLEVIAGGLSFGAPLSAATVAFSGSDSIFTKQILMSPFFGVSSGSADNLLYKCFLNGASFAECLPLYFTGIGFDIESAQSEALATMALQAIAAFVDVELLDASYETANVLLRKVLEWIVENPDTFADAQVKQKIEDTLLGVISWGEQCLLDVADRDRGGFCQFETRHLLAAHSFAGYLVDTVRDLDRDPTVQTLTILVERDGPTRNSLLSNYLNRYYNYDDDVMGSVSQCCMWLIAQTCQAKDYTGGIDNTCGVPHSSMAAADNLGLGAMWWEESYHQGMISWFNGDTFADNFMEKAVWDTTRNQCIFVDLSKPSSALIADVPSVLSIVMSAVEQKATVAGKTAVLNGLSDLLGMERGVLELTYKAYAIRRGANAAGDGSSEDEFGFVVDLSPQAARLISVLLDRNVLKKIANYSIVYAEIEGKEYNVEQVQITPSPTNDCNGLRLSSWIIAVGCFISIFVV